MIVRGSGFPSQDHCAKPAFIRRDLRRNFFGPELGSRKLPYPSARKGTCGARISTAAIV